MGTGQQQEATVSKVDPGVSDHESGVRSVIEWGGETPVESAAPTRKNQPGFPMCKRPGVSTPL